jgi:hypothetical protein
LPVFCQFGGESSWSISFTRSIMEWLLSFFSSDTFASSSAADHDTATKYPAIAELPCKPIDWLLLLPEELLASVLSDWINIQDVANVDAAHCNRLKRPALLRILAGRVVQDVEPICERLEEDARWEELKPVMKWIMLRRVGINSVYIKPTVEFEIDRLQTYVEMKGDKIRRVYFNPRVESVQKWESAFELLCKHCPNVIHFTCAYNIAPLEYCNRLSVWRGLQSLTLGAAVTGTDLRHIAQAFTGLTHIDARCHITPSSGGWQQHLVTRGAMLTHFAASTGLSNAVYSAIATHCPQLRSLSIDWTHANTSLATQIAQGCSLLESLNLCNYDTVSPEVVLIFAQSGNLRELEFCIEEGGDAVIAEAVKRCSQLRKLSMVMEAIHTTLDAIAETCRHLEVLELVWWTAESSAKLNAQLAAIARVSPKLRQLRLRGPFVERGNEGVCDATLLVFGDCCPLLTHVTIEGTNSVTDIGLVALARGCPWLRVIRLRSTVVTMQGMRAMAAHCRHLESVCVAHKSLVAEMKAAQVFRKRVKVSSV